MSEVSKDEIILIQRNFENAVGALQFVQANDLNAAEKLQIFLTCARILNRVGLWCTTLNHNFYHQFIQYCSTGYQFDLDYAIALLLKYAEAFLVEADKMRDRFVGACETAPELEMLEEFE